jgi:hypothetical protein
MATVNNDSAKTNGADISSVNTFTLRKEQPKEVETAAGVVKIMVSERPFLIQIEDKYGVHTGPDQDRKTVNYQISLVSGDQVVAKGHVELVSGGISGLYCAFQEYFADAGIASKDSKAAYLQAFFPFGMGNDKYANSEHKRKGVGSAVLGRVLEDCESGGVSVVCAISTFPNMKGLLRKFDFKDIPQAYNFFYLKLPDMRQG